MLRWQGLIVLSASLSLVACGSAPSQETAPAKQHYSAKTATSNHSNQVNRQQGQPHRNQYIAHNTNPTQVSVSTRKRASLPAQSKHLPIEVKQALAQNGVAERGMSVYVKNVNSSRPSLAFQEAVPRNPASVMKLLTTYGALGVLGPNHRWPVEVYTMGNVSGGVLRGDLIFKGYGYPDFNERDLQQILQAVRRKGIQRIDGSLVFDNSAFRIPYKHPGSFDGKPTASYNAQPDALLFNERQGCFVVQASGKPSVSCPESSKIVTVKNNLRLVDGPCRGRPKMKAIPQGNKVVVEFYGDYSRQCGEQRLFNVGLFAKAWKIWTTQLGGSIGGGFLQGRTPPNASLIYTYYSKPLREVLATVNKESNNVMARQLLLSMGIKENGVGTIEGGVQAMRKWFASRGLSFPELRVENGSGLSRHSRVSAKSIANLLDDAYHSPYRNEFMHSLAVMGVDGTLKRRMKNTSVRGRGRFKTGTLKDVRGIAGYVRASDGQTYVVSILHNDPKARSRALKAHDQMIQWAFNGSRHNQQYAMR
jgi:D-alanyl-D-alanine carboxypeptidase/D-alanyl-D-alanine-endopeptidase (penicillin-binding protein 4)